MVAEEERFEIPQVEPVLEVASEPPITTAPERLETKNQATPEATPTAQPEPEPTPESETEPETNDGGSGDIVYVPGFGWLKSQGPNQGEHAEDMCENGNKIGSIG